MPVNVLIALIVLLVVSFLIYMDLSDIYKNVVKILTCCNFAQ